MNNNFTEVYTEKEQSLINHGNLKEEALVEDFAKYFSYFNIIIN